jgi:hypothetical protein
MKSIQPADLTASANEIDSRLGPIPGRSADRYALQFRAAADELQRAMDMLGDVPGVTLTERLQHYIGSYMALQLRIGDSDKMREAITKTRTNLAGLSNSDDDIYAAMVRRLDGACQP